MGSREPRRHMDSGKPCVQLTVVKLRHMSRMALRCHMQVVPHNYKEVISIYCIVIAHFREVINSKDVLFFWGWFSFVGSFIFRSGKACFASWIKSVSMSVFVTWIHPHDFGTAPERNLTFMIFHLFMTIMTIMTIKLKTFLTRDPQTRKIVTKSMCCVLFLFGA